MPDHIQLQDVSFRYPSMTQPIFEGVSAHLTRGWTGVVGANGAGKSTLMKLICGDLKPQGGILNRPSGQVVYCEQRTDDPPPNLSAFLAANDGDAWMWRGRLGVEEDWEARWPTLSHGERKRAQIAAALWEDPSVFAVDEPTNHLDRTAKDDLFQALKSFRGVGILVSHDRDLLDDLCGQCLFCEPPKVIVRKGGYTSGTEAAEMDAEQAVRERDQAKADLQRLEAEAARRRAVAAKSHQMRSKKGLGKGDNDERYKRNLARVTGKDGQGGRLLKQMEGRVEQAAETLANAKVSKTYASGIWPPGSQSKKDVVLALEEQTIRLGDGKSLEVPNLTIRRDDRIALVGDNGCGKSTLIDVMMRHATIPEDRVIYLKQEVTVDDSRALLDEVKSLKRDQLGQVMAIISRLNSRPERLLESTTPSPGEIWKLMLALGISRSPYLIVMDEPTNHLDLPSIASLEDALTDCPCCLVLVSHDARFVDALADRVWAFGREKHDVYRVIERTVSRVQV